MKAIHWTIAAAALAFVQTTPASAGINDPEIIIYRFPGVRYDGGADQVGVATVFHCTNFSGATERIRFVSREVDGTLVTNATFNINHLATLGVGTNFVKAYPLAFSLVKHLINEGTMAIAATSTNVICTAMTIDASTVAPVGVALRGIRFSPVPGSQE
jgi:hypothetical protein